MCQLSPIVFASIVGLVGCSSAQQFPPPASYDKVLKSPIDPNITISYKEPDPGTCTTAFSSQKQYSGYVNLPPFTLAPYQQAYPINTFFWFFEARNNSDTAPLTIWLNGGPGSSSMIGLFREMGPCEVVQLHDGSYATQMNAWGWDRSSNLLFIDQPTQVGFSYDRPVNVSWDFIKQHIVEPPASLPNGVPPWSFLNGTLATGERGNVENSTVIAARAAWHFLQGFLSAFPQYNPGHRPDQTVMEPTGVNIFAESYGGQYGPIFADYFEDQNDRRRAGVIPANSTLEIKVDSLGIINGLVDTLIQTPALASFVYNNTYDVQGMSQNQYLNLLNEFGNRDGCLERASKCHSKAIDGDYEGENLDEGTIDTCSSASKSCWGVQSRALQLAGRNPYDIRVTSPNSFPSYAYLEYLNQPNVLRSIGAKVNFTDSTNMVNIAFHQTGDDVRGTQIKKLADLLTRGIRVALIYGDADIICNWVGGEAVSLALAHESAYRSTFPAAGYADIISNDSYVGGHVRQYGNLSFSRIFDAGHTTPSYQAETSFVVFSRIINGNDIGTGRHADLSTFGTQGAGKSLYKNKVPPQAQHTCWIRAIDDTCTEDERRQISQGLGVVKYGQWSAQSQEAPPNRPGTLDGKPSSLAVDSNAHDSRSTTTSSIALTGIFTALTTPTPASGASRLLFRVHSRQRRQLVQAPAAGRLPEFGTAASSAKNGLIGGTAAVGGLLLLLLTLAACCLSWRRHRSKKHARKFMGGPRRTPSPLPNSEPSTPRTEQPEPKRNIVQRFAQRHRKEPQSAPAPAPARYDIERPEEPPVLDRRHVRRLSAPMEPILEAHSPRPSGDIPQRRVSEPPNNLIVAQGEEPTSIIQRNVGPSSSTSSASLAENSSKTREPSPEQNLFRQLSLQLGQSRGSKPDSTPDEPHNPEVPAPVQRSTSLPSEDKTSEADPPPAPASRSEPDTSPENKPSLLKRIRSSFHHDNEALKAKSHTLF